MHRTQVYLERAQYERLRARARQQGKTMAAVIRELLEAALAGARGLEQDPFDGVVGLAAGDGSAVAEHHADYLYGEELGPPGSGLSPRPPERPGRPDRSPEDAT